MLSAKNFYDKIADKYDSIYTDNKFIEENEYIKKRLEKIIKDDSIVIDIGCGTGLLLELIPVKPTNYYGVDISKKMTAIATKKFPKHKFITGDIIDCNTVSPNSLDVSVSLFACLSFVKDIKKAIENISDKMKKNSRYLYMLYHNDYKPFDQNVFHSKVKWYPRDCNEIIKLFRGATDIEVYHGFIIVEGINA